MLKGLHTENSHGIYVCIGAIWNFSVCSCIIGGNMGIEQYQEFYMKEEIKKSSVTISRESFQKSNDVARILDKVRRKEIVITSFKKNDETGYSIGTLKKESEKLGSQMYAVDNLLFIVPKEISLRTG